MSVQTFSTLRLAHGTLVSGGWNIAIFVRVPGKGEDLGKNTVGIILGTDGYVCVQCGANAKRVLGKNGTLQLRDVLPGVWQQQFDGTLWRMDRPINQKEANELMRLLIDYYKNLS